MHFLDSIVRPRRLFLFRDLTLALRVNDICILSGERLLFHGDLLLSEARESRGGGGRDYIKEKTFPYLPPYLSFATQTLSIYLDLWITQTCVRCIICTAIDSAILSVREYTRRYAHARATLLPRSLQSRIRTW